jgi:hypothetical protein
VDPCADRARRTGALLLFACLLLEAGGGAAQPPDRAIEFDDLGLTVPVDVSPRSCALTSLAATTADAAALVYNPAGLARVKRITTTLALSGRRAEVGTRYNGETLTHASGRYGLQFVGGAVPQAAVRGSFVPAAAIYRAFVSDLDVEYAGYNELDRRDDDFLLQQDGSTFAFAIGMGIDLADAVSIGLSLFALEGGFDALRQFNYRDRDPAATTHTYVVEDLSGDLNGVGGRIGLQFFAHRHLQLGVNFTTPTILDAHVDQTREETQWVQNDVGTSTRTTSSVSTRYQLPYRIEGAVAVPWGAWLVAGEVGVADWGSAVIDGQRLLLANGNTVLGRVVAWRAGLEWTAARWPVRLRLGAARSPFATRYLQTDRIDNDALEPQSRETPAMSYSAGGGVLLRERVSIDASLTVSSGERGSEHTGDRREWSQVLIQGSYWF